MDKAFLYWKYVERVCAKYSELNEPINRESFGPLSATLQAPAIVIVIQILGNAALTRRGCKVFLCQLFTNRLYDARHCFIQCHQKAFAQVCRSFWS